MNYSILTDDMMLDDDRMQTEQLQEIFAPETERTIDDADGGEVQSFLRDELSGENTSIIHSLDVQRNNSTASDVDVDVYLSDSLVGIQETLSNPDSKSCDSSVWSEPGGAGPSVPSPSSRPLKEVRGMENVSLRQIEKRRRDRSRKAKKEISTCGANDVGLDDDEGGNLIPRSEKDSKQLTSQELEVVPNESVPSPYSYRPESSISLAREVLNPARQKAQTARNALHRRLSLTRDKRVEEYKKAHLRIADVQAKKRVANIDCSHGKQLYDQVYLHELASFLREMEIELNGIEGRANQSS